MGPSIWIVMFLLVRCSGGAKLPHSLLEPHTSPCRLSGGKTVVHGEQIERDDPCEICLCLNGNMFCWWGQQHCWNTTATDSALPLDNITDVSNSSSWTEEYDTEDTTSAANTTDVISTTHVTKCTVMGKEYTEGQVLPPDTGTCLECVCGSEGRVTCSPKDCVRPSDDFHNSDPNNSLDMFDVDVF